MCSFAKVSEVKVETKLITDDGFTCIKERETVIIEEDKDGLFFRCKYGKHFIGGQIENDEYIGLYLA